MSTRLPGVVVVTCLAMGIGAPADAYTFETPASRGCHEEITLAALARRVDPDSQVESAADPEDALLAGALLFHSPPGANRWTLSLLVGVRDNDLAGAAITDLPELSGVHNGLDTQAPHCLRGPGDDGVGGDLQALAACRAFITSELAAAAENSGERIEVPVALAYPAGPVAVERFAFHLGRALHALQDSYAHALRTGDHARVRTVMNYVDPAQAPSYDAERDGAAHQSALDRCDEPSRVDATTLASAALIEAALAPADQRWKAVDAVLDQTLAYEGGCSPEDHWCGLAPPATGCSAAAGAPAALGVVLVAAALRRRATRTLMVAVTAIPVATMAAPAASWSSAPHPAVHLIGSGAIDRGGAQLSLGADLPLGEQFRAGLAAEYSAWFDLLSPRLNPGVANLYGSFGVTWYRAPGVEVASTAMLGASVLLFDSLGARAGSVGAFIGLGLVRVTLPLTGSLALELCPDVTAEVPSLRGVPLAYRQYRLGIGLRWDLGGGTR